MESMLAFILGHSHDALASISISKVYCLQMVTLSDDSAVRIWRLARPLVGAPGEGSDMEVGKCERIQREIGT